MRARGNGGPATDRGGATLELVLSTSTELFAQCGYAATTMRQLAERAELPLSAFYYYFSSKYEVLCAIMDSGMARVEAAIEAAADPDSPAGEQLVALVRAHVLTHLEEPGVARVVDGEIRALADPERRAITARRDAYERRFRRVLEQGVHEGTFGRELDVRVAAMSILTMGTGVIHWWRPGGRLSAADVADQVGYFALDVALGRARSELAG